MDARTLAEKETIENPCLLCGEESDHKHKDGGNCCMTCCSMWGGLAGKPEHEWIDEIWNHALKKYHSWIKITDDPQTLPQDEQLYEFVIGPNIVGIGICRHGLWLVPDPHEENDFREVHGVTYWREIGELPEWKGR